jgi:hypothetical protein
MKPRTPRSPKYLAWLRRQPCAWTGEPPPCEAAHFGRRGVGLKASDLDALPLAPWVHRWQHGPRFGNQPPLPPSPRWPVETWTSEDVRWWAAGYALGLRYRIALASMDPTEPSRW